MFLALLNENDDRRAIRRCPATILADSRIERVMGRIILLIISIITIKFIKALGVPKGVRWVIMFLNLFFQPNIIVDSHILILIVNLTEICAVGVKLKGKIALKFIISNVVNNDRRIMLVIFKFFLISWLSSFSTNTVREPMMAESFSSFLLGEFFTTIRGTIIIAHPADILDEDGSNIENILFIIIIFYSFLLFCGY